MAKCRELAHSLMSCEVQRSCVYMVSVTCHILKSCHGTITCFRRVVYQQHQRKFVSNHDDCFDIAVLRGCSGGGTFNVNMSHYKASWLHARHYSISRIYIFIFSGQILRDHESTLPTEWRIWGDLEDFFVKKEAEFGLKEILLN